MHQSRHESGRRPSYKLGRGGFKYQTRTITSRELPKSAPYLRLKIEKGDPSGFVKLQLAAKNEKKEGGPFGDMKKFPKKFF